MPPGTCISGLLMGYDRLKVLSKGTTDLRRLHSTYPMRTLKDLRGRKFRVSGKFHVDLFKSLGAIPISFPVQQTAENLSRGLVDGVLMDTSAVFNFRLNEVVTYYLKTPAMGCSASAIVMMQEKFDSLPRRGKLAIEMYRGRPIIYPAANVMWGESKKYLTQAEQDPRYTVHDATPAEMKEWKTAMQPIIDKWKQEYPKGEMLIREFQRELEWIRAGGFGIAQ